MTDKKTNMPTPPWHPPVLVPTDGTEVLLQIHDGIISGHYEDTPDDPSTNFKGFTGFVCMGGVFMIPMTEFFTTVKAWAYVPNTTVSFAHSFGFKMGDVYAVAVSKGWHDCRNEIGTDLALIHGEVSEALEAARVGNPQSKHIPGFTCIEEELADVVIRCMDVAVERGWRLAEAIVEKNEYNMSRPHRHGGKKF
jgi:NTP pyrophosphatase (non-canonical NTP hydrolase)